MSYKMRLFSLRPAHALQESCRHEPYSTKRFLKDLLAGITVGIIAIPLAMALAIASGVAPQYGLYSAIIAGFLIPLLGGSRYSISGPTAAFVVIIYPVAHHYGLAGLLIATLFSGGLLILMSILRLGRFIEYISDAVTLGFTAGIAVVIVMLQLKDFFGLSIPSMPEENIGKFITLWQYLHTIHLPSTVVAFLTLLIMFLWPRLKTPILPHFPALIFGTLFSMMLASHGWAVETIGSRFTFLFPDGQIGHGIPPFFPSFTWPWEQAGPDGQAFVWSWETLRALLYASFGIAMLGAIESLLCAVVLEGMTGKPHSANSELFGQGVGNIIAPFFGGITATAAIARSAANVKAGAESPIAAMIHALVVFLGLVFLGPILAYLPMPSLAALLVVVAWKMSEAPKGLRLLKTSPTSDRLVFLTCFLLTILLDMVIAITAGIILASILFMKEIAEMTKVHDITDHKKLIPASFPKGWKVFKINGALFFAAADRILGELSYLCSFEKGLIISLEGVPVLDAGGVSALNRLVAHCQKTKTHLYLTDIQFQPLKTLAQAGCLPIPGVVSYCSTLSDALTIVSHTP